MILCNGSLFFNFGGANLKLATPNLKKIDFSLRVMISNILIVAHKDPIISTYIF